MKGPDYWKQRFELMEVAQHDLSMRSLAEIEDMFVAAKQALESKISVWYQRFANNNKITLAEAKQQLQAKQLAEFRWDVKQYIKYGKENALNQQWMKQLENASARVHITRLEALQLQTQQVIERLATNQLGTVDHLMKKQYLEGYYKTLFETQKGFNVGWDIAAVSEGQLQRVLGKPWTVDERTFSDKIWTDKNKLVNQVHTELTRSMILGEAPDKAIRNIAKATGASKKFAGRLVVTESAYFANVAQHDAYVKLGVERFQVSETLDGKTCEVCGAMDGKDFPLKDFQVGVNVPPFHPWCRGCTVPYFDDDIGERAARDGDGKVYFVPSDMKYEEWKASYVDKTQKPRTKSNSVLTNGNNGGIIKDDPYTQERKDAALWAKTPQEADDALRQVSGDVWRGATQEEKDAIYDYTLSSDGFNRPLRGYDGNWNNFKGVGNVDLNNEGKGVAIQKMTELIDKSFYDFDIWLQRGNKTSKGTASFLQISESDLLNWSQQELEQNLLGKMVYDKAFSSCGSAEGKGFSGYVFKIYCPKGTKMMYSEPFSHYGNGDKLNWDGISKQSSFGAELETLIQRNTKFRIIKVEKLSNSKVNFEMEVISQT